jgi:hypothetical protein
LEDIFLCACWPIGSAFLRAIWPCGSAFFCVESYGGFAELSSALIADGGWIFGDIDGGRISASRWRRSVCVLRSAGDLCAFAAGELASFCSCSGRSDERSRYRWF